MATTPQAQQPSPAIVFDTLSRKVHTGLKPGGRAATLEFVPNEDGISPPATAQFSLTMLASTPAGDAYTFREYEGMFRNAGFSRSEIQPLPAHAAAVDHLARIGRQGVVGGIRQVRWEGDMK